MEFTNEKGRRIRTFVKYSRRSCDSALRTTMIMRCPLEATIYSRNFKHADQKIDVQCVEGLFPQVAWQPRHQGVWGNNISCGVGKDERSSHSYEKPALASARHLTNMCDIGVLFTGSFLINILQEYPGRKYFDIIPWTLGACTLEVSTRIELVSIVQILGDLSWPVR